MTAKICTKCKVEKPSRDFHKRAASRKDGLSFVCKKCHNIQSFKWNKKNPENIKRNRRNHYKNNPYMAKNNVLKLLYGITLQDYDRMFSDQGGLCGICLESETSINKATGKLRALSVDHNHKTGKVRKLLCTDCNTGIGKFKENPELLLKAITYLEVA